VKAMPLSKNDPMRRNGRRMLARRPPPQRNRRGLMTAQQWRRLFMRRNASAMRPA